MVDQDLFGPANCELFEEFKILMATRANYTANASVRYATLLFCNAVFLVFFDQCCTFFLMLTSVRTHSFRSSLSHSLSFFLFYSSSFYHLSLSFTRTVLFDPPSSHLPSSPPPTLPPPSHTHTHPPNPSNPLLPSASPTRTPGHVVRYPPV